MAVELVKGVALLLALALLHKYILRFSRGFTTLSNMLSGFLFGGMCIVVMSVPLVLSPGVIFNPRSVILGMSGLFAGVPGAVICAAFAGGYRFILGGDGMQIGIATIVMCAAAGLLFRYLVQRRWVDTSPLTLLAFGFLIHLGEVALFTQLPPPIARHVLSTVAVPLILTFTPAVLLLGLLLRDNERAIRLSAELKAQKDKAIHARDELAAALTTLRHKQELIDRHAIFSETDKQGKIVTINDLFCEISGYSRGQLIGQDHRILNSGHHPKDFFADMWRTISTGNVWRGDIKNRRADGSEYWVKSTILPVRDESGAVSGYASIRTDITEDRQRQKMAEDARNEANEANAAKSNFIATMSHELRTPLNAIIGFSEMMRHEAFGPIGHDKYREYLDDIFNSGQALKGMVDDILDITKLDLRTYEFHDETYDPVQYSREIARRFLPGTSAKEITIAVEASDDFPATLTLDKKVQQHVLNNLLSNAIKFTPDGGTIRVAWSVEHGGSIVCTVSDTGTGMPEETLSKLGEPFLVTENPNVSKRADEGVGLGFYITKSLVEARGGTVEVRSALNEGTEVRLVFPIEVMAKRQPS